MANTTVRNIPDDDYGLLRKEARRRGTSLNTEILDAIRNKADDLKRRRRAATSIARIDKLRAEIARRFPRHTDSALLIREDRDGR
jgi:Antitoxin FitA-like, ribbon-helix-helix